MLTDALDDGDADQRVLGINAGLAWRRAFFHTENGVRHVLPAFYLDLGWSGGMKDAQVLYEKEGVLYERRNLPPEDSFFSDLVRCAGFYGDERAHTDPACGWIGARRHLVDMATCPTCGAGHIVEYK
jgi:hypothetical protein